VTSIDITADWHADFTRDDIDLPLPACDLHLVLGDAAAPMTKALEIVAKTFEHATAPVAYLAGNHDYYYTSERPQTYYQDELGNGRHRAHQHGITLMHNDVVVIGDTRVLGTTLWTNIGARPGHMSIRQAMEMSQKGWYGDMSRSRYDRDLHNDFREIRYGGPGNRNRFTPAQWLQLHAEAMEFLRTELAQEWDGATVVASHMAPSVESLMPGHHAHDWLYATTDCDDLFQHVDLWAHGHIHASRDYEIAGCRIVCNPRGYPQPGKKFENPSWDPGFVVDVEPRYNRRMTP
jgi:DNA repair exonuclease SbcCD nuclease subunit